MYHEKLYFHDEFSLFYLTKQSSVQFLEDYPFFSDEYFEI